LPARTVANGLRATKRTITAVLGARSEPATVAKAAPKTQKTIGRRPHLKLAPVDLAPERDPILKFSNELVVADTEDPQKRAQAVALWRSLNATLQEIAGSESRTQALESDLKGMHDITVKNRHMLDDLTRRLGKAESERYSNPLVYVLLAAIVLFCLAIAYGWNRAPRGLAGAPWWRHDGTEDKAKIVKFDGDVAPTSKNSHDAVSRKAALSAENPFHGTPRPSSLGATRMEDIDLLLGDPVDDRQKPVKTRLKESVPLPTTSSKPVSTSSSGHIDFAHSLSATLRSVNTKEMLDVRQQAEFFMTLGQHDEAIALLSESVDGSADANPLVYLGLLKVLHTLGRKEQYDKYRIGFNAIFSGQVPAYADFNESGSGLEAYPETCQRVVALWPSEDVVFYIENCLVRAPKESGGHDFEAFRDLLMLHGVANRIASSSFDSGFMAFSTAKTAPAPMGGASELDIDFDLSEPHDNMIDFDASGWLPPTPTDDKQKPR
jgi:pilus assembly protein FimV